MLNYAITGPYKDGSFLVGYRVPGCQVVTPTCQCVTASQALAELDRLNKKQIASERALKNDRELRGLSGVYPLLEN
jgi:hypothetical protein